MSRPADTVIVKDAAGIPRQVHSVDAKEIVAAGGTYEVSEEEMAEAKAGEAAEDDPNTKADKEAGTKAPKKK